MDPVRVHTDEGISGIGEATSSHKELVVAKMVLALRDQLVGRDPFDREAIYVDVYASGRAGYRTGGAIFTSAMSEIDQALWDIKGKALEVPVCAMLGGPREARIPVFTHFDGPTTEARIDNAQRRIDEGFHGHQVGHDGVRGARASSQTKWTSADRHRVRRSPRRAR